MKNKIYILKQIGNLYIIDYFLINIIDITSKKYYHKDDYYYGIIRSSITKYGTTRSSSTRQMIA